MALRSDVESLRRRVRAIAGAAGQAPGAEAHALSDEEFDQAFEADPTWSLVWMYSQIEDDAARACSVSWLEGAIQGQCCAWLAALELRDAGVPIADIPARLVEDYLPLRCWQETLGLEPPWPKWDAAHAERLLLFPFHDVPDVTLELLLPVVDAHVGSSRTPEAVVAAFGLECYVDAVDHMRRRDPYLRQLGGWRRGRAFDCAPVRLRRARVET